MTAEALIALARANLAGSIVILAVLILRPPLRRRFGPEAAYWLWAAPPIAALAALVPREDARAVATLSPWQGLAEGLGPVAGWTWLAGACLAVVFVAWLHLAFLRQARRGRAGPAVVGLICPSIIMPSPSPFSPEERLLAREHEREHIRRKDPLARAVIALVQCVNWFNPLVHLAAEAVRLDQELACDAAVLRRHPGRRRTYAEALLKGEAPDWSPLGCCWRAIGRHPLELRVAAIAASPTPQTCRNSGPALIAAAAVACGCLAWLAQPATAPRPRFVWHSPAAQMVLVDLSPSQRAISGR